MLSYKYLSYFERQIKGKLSDHDTLTTKLELPKTNIKDCGTKVQKIHNLIIGLESDKEKGEKRFFNCRETFSLKIKIL